MVYTKKSPALFIIGVIMLAIWFTAGNGMLDGFMEHLAAGKNINTVLSLPVFRCTLGYCLLLSVHGNGSVATVKAHGIITHRQ